LPFHSVCTVSDLYAAKGGSIMMSKHQSDLNPCNLSTVTLENCRPPRRLFPRLRWKRRLFYGYAGSHNTHCHPIRPLSFLEMPDMRAVEPICQAGACPHRPHPGQIGGPRTVHHRMSPQWLHQQRPGHHRPGAADGLPLQKVEPPM